MSEAQPRGAQAPELRAGLARWRTLGIEDIVVALPSAPFFFPDHEVFGPRERAATLTATVNSFLYIRGKFNSTCLLLVFNQFVQPRGRNKNNTVL
ncbi:MAG: hypothetical protein EXR83_02000 [Gammaproteobacteria bacterium]|nr:hypothetical protein [Gammaproteobacteria bacterium]